MLAFKHLRFFKKHLLSTPVVIGQHAFGVPTIMGFSSEIKSLSKSSAGYYLYGSITMLFKIKDPTYRRGS